MKFPSLQSLGSDAWRTFLRFPIAILLVIKASAFGMYWSHLVEKGRFSEVSAWYWNVIETCYLGMLLSVAVTVWAEKRRGGGAGRVVGPGVGGEARGGGEVGRKGPGLATWLQLGVLILAGAYYWSLPPEFSQQAGLRTIVLALGLHWLIAVVGFGRGEVNGFWIFNKRLFLRILTSALYAGVLYVGVSLGLLAIDHLFNIDVRGEAYMDCWWAFGGVFSVWFFLAGFPRGHENPAVIDNYPKGLKIFTQYVLLTLVTIYLLILYAYMVKIVVTAHWPGGWVGWLVMAFSVLGILSLLLIYPLRNDENNTWIRNYARFFYFALLPLIVLLFCAIYKRIAPYGITEQRYLLLALAFWVLFITLYFLASRWKDIRLVPLSLCILAFVSCWGPWGAFSVSLKSQERRLTGILGKYGLMADGKIVRAGEGLVISKKDRVSISSIIDYVTDDHGYRALQPMFRQNLDSMMRINDDNQRWRPNGATKIMDLMNIKYTSRYDWMQTDSEAVAPANIKQEFYFSVEPQDSATTIEGEQYAARFNWINVQDSCYSLTTGKESLQLCLHKDDQTIRLAWAPGGEAAVVGLRPVILEVQQWKYGSLRLPAERVTFPINGPLVKGRLVVSDVWGTRLDSIVTIERIEGMILFSRK